MFPPINTSRPPYLYRFLSKGGWLFVFLHKSDQRLSVFYQEVKGFLLFKINRTKDFIVLHQILTSFISSLKYQNSEYSEYSAPICKSSVNMLLFVVKLCCQDFVGNFCSQTLTIQVLTTRVLDGSGRADRAGWTVGLIKRKINEKIRLFKFVKCVQCNGYECKSAIWDSCREQYVSI